MTNMAAMPIYGKNLKKSSTPEPLDRWPWNLVCSIVYESTTKLVQIMTLGWPWLILRQGQIWLVGWLVVLGLTALWDSISVYIGPSPREREEEKRNDRREKKTSKQPPPAPIASAIGPCPTIIQISRTPWHWKFTQHHRTTRPPPQIWSHRLLYGKRWKFIYFLETIAALGLKVAWSI